MSDNGLSYSRGMEKKLSWQEIKQGFDQEWVELIEYDWPDEEAFPRSGIVRVHAKSRREFDRLINQDPPLDSALVYVGERKPEPGVIYSANLHQWKIVKNEAVRD